MDSMLSWVCLQVLSKLPLDRPDAREKVEKILSGLKWPQFPGLHSLLLKVRYQHELSGKKIHQKSGH